MDYLIGFLIGWASCLTGTFIALYLWSDKLVHRIRYKRYVLPCPACRDEETDEPTGQITPDNPYLQQHLGPQTFDCTTCDGTKKIVYEFPRHEKPDINERQILEGPAPGQPQPKKGIFG